MRTIYLSPVTIKCVSEARSGFITRYESVLGAGANCKNHDKLINYTVRVRFSLQSYFCQEAGYLRLVDYAMHCETHLYLVYDK
jgi:hypothetical protein